MLKRLLLLVILFAPLSFISGEENEDDGVTLPEGKDAFEDLKNQLGGGFGVTVIDGETYTTFALNPEIAIWKIGIGLDLFLRISTKTGKIREEDYSDGAYRKIIRYIRYGYKNEPDPLYFRLGVLDNATLGTGFLISNYTNSPSFEDRNMGLEFDMDFKKWGFETLYGNFTTAGLIGTRLFIRPFKFTSLENVWLIGDLELGSTYVADLNDNANILEETPTNRRTAPGRIAQIGVDVQAPLVKNSLLLWMIYVDYGHIVNYGHGQAFGTSFNFGLWSVFDLGIKLERRNLGEQFIANYFNSLYEVQRYKNSNGVTSTKASQIETAESSGGSYASILIRILKFFAVIGSYQKSDLSDDGIFHAEARLPDIPVIEIRAGYDRVGISKAQDLFKLDERSLLFAFIGYKVVDGAHFRAVFGFNYQWTFKPVGDSLVTQERVEPTFSLSYRW